ncbi:MAG: DUF1883 domain-containing protein [Flavobacteriales bacterium]|nr:DUF1883 domain-containing protein [Flavobacteriales bacterium]
MKFLHKQYQAKKKEIIEVELDRAAKVKFMTAMDFKQYKNGRSHKYYGGLFEESPVRFVIPHDAVWYAVVEKGSSAAPQDVVASTRLMLPNRAVVNSLAVDAPQHVRLAQSEEGTLIGEGSEENG